MADTVFEEDKSVFFVMDEADSVANAGGCTQAWWDTECPNGTEAEAAAAMAKLLDSTGTPLIEMTECAYTQSMSRITKTNIAIGVEVGMVAYVIESGTPNESVETGRYTITARDLDDDWFECEGIDGTGDTDVYVVIGGAFSTLQEALDETDATDHSVTIHIQSEPTLTAQIDVDAGGGNNVKNTFKRLVGFNTSPGDMNIGGTYYQSPIEILQAGSIDNTKAVLLDGNDDVTIFDIGVDNVIIENFHFYNTDTAINPAIVLTGTPENIAFRNCKISSCRRACQGAAINVLFDSCYTHDDLLVHQFSVTGGDSTFLNCVVKGIPTKFIIYCIGARVTVIGCLVAGNALAAVYLATAGASAFVMNNTFYNTRTYGIRLNNTDSAIVINNIFALEAGVAAKALYALTAGSYLYNDYNCFIETDGTPLIVGFHEDGEAPVIGPHSIAVNPLFVDAANYDFRLAGNSPCIDAGRPDSLGGWSTIGAYDYSANRGVSRSRVIGGL